jgi:DNA polymerase III subunit delta'
VSFDGLLGQDAAKRTLVRALESGRVHHAYRFEGPAGVGKELAAFRLAQALVCTEPGPFACEACSACRRSLTISDRPPHVPLHPDVILIETGLYPEGVIGRDERQGVSVEQIRRIVLAQVGFTPAENKARVFIFRRADELTPQAANALLKTLEEPRPATHFILMTARPEKLLPTIRSRSMLVRFGALSDEVLSGLLREKGVAEALIADVVPLAEGSVDKALELAEPERAESRAAFLRAVAEAVRAGTAGAAVKLAEGADSDRRMARDRLFDLASHLSALARKAEPEDALALARGYEAVMAATENIEMANASPAHVLTDLALSLHRVGAGEPLVRATAPRTPGV